MTRLETAEASTALKPAVIYTRISTDRDGEGESIDRHERECRDWADQHGFTITHVYADNDISASSGRGRPDYVELLGDIAAGAVQTIISTEKARLHRNVAELEHFIGVCRAVSPVPLVHLTRGGVIDASHADGRLGARVGGVVDTHSSEVTSERIVAKHKDLAAAGVWMSGTNVYGYNIRTVQAVGGGKRRAIQSIEINGAEAAVIREGVERVLAGEAADGLATIAKDLNSRGILAKNGGPWRSVSLKQVLTAARNAGYREHTPIKKAADGRTVKALPGRGLITKEGNWDPIISLDELQAVRAILCNPDRKKTRPGKYLLSRGVAFCGKCGGRLNSKSPGNGTHWYGCHPLPGTDRCGGVTISMPYLDDYVTGVVLEALAVIDLGAAAAAVPDVTGILVLAQLRERLREAALGYAEGEFTKDEYLGTIKPAILARIDAVTAENQADRTSHLRALKGMPTNPKRLRAWFESQTLEKRSSIILAVVEKVVVNKVTRYGSNRFDPSRVELVWRDSTRKLSEGSR